MSIILKLKTAIAKAFYPQYYYWVIPYKECKKMSETLGSDIGCAPGRIHRQMYRDYLRHGSSPEDWLAFEFWKKSDREKSTYMTTRKNWFEFTPKMVPSEIMPYFNDKEQFSRTFSDFMKRDWIVATAENESAWTDFVNRHGKVIAKPAGGCEGIGIFMVSPSDSSSIERLRKETSAGNKFVLEQLIEQHPDMVRLNEASVNTLRIETTIDKDGNTHITNTICIIGTGGDIINNAHNGGVMCHVDEETGILSSWARNPKGKNLFRHPDTGLVFPGYHIPMWNEILDFAVKLSQVVPEARYIGWDIAVTEDGPVVIEGNTYPGHCTQACDMTGRWPLLKSLM